MAKTVELPPYVKRKGGRLLRALETTALANFALGMLFPVWLALIRLIMFGINAE